MQTRKELYDLLKYKPGDEWVYPNSITKIKKEEQDNVDFNKFKI